MRPFLLLMLVKPGHSTALLGFTGIVGDGRKGAISVTGKLATPIKMTPTLAQYDTKHQYLPQRLP